jgi:hypothetical protein
LIHDKCLQKQEFLCLNPLQQPLLHLTGDIVDRKYTHQLVIVHDPAVGKEVPFRQVIQMVDDTHMVMERYFPNSKDGKEFKAMRIEFVKK